MAKYFSIVPEVSMIADADFSGSANQYRFVALTASVADHIELAAGASLPGPFGVMQNSPCSGEEMAIRTIGFSKLRCETVQQGDTTGASPININDYLTSTSTGTGRKAGGAASPAFARAMNAVASGSAFIQVMLLINGANVLSAS